MNGKMSKKAEKTDEHPRFCSDLAVGLDHLHIHESSPCMTGLVIQNFLNRMLRTSTGDGQCSIELKRGRCKDRDRPVAAGGPLEKPTFAYYYCVHLKRSEDDRMSE